MVTIPQDDPVYNVETFMKLRPVFYNPKDDCGDETKRYVGLIAEEVQDIGLREMVSYGENDKVMGLGYDRISVFTMKVVQEQQKIIQEQQQKINDLEEQIKLIKSYLNI